MFALGEQAWGSVTSPYEMDEERDEIELESENERTDREATTDEFDEDEWDKSGCWLVTSGRVLLFVMFVWLVTLQVSKVRDWLSGMNVRNGMVTGSSRSLRKGNAYSNLK